MSHPLKYVGKRLPDGVVVTIEGDGHVRPLHHVQRHSPTGFEFGYAGSGPADLAHSILVDVLNVKSVAPGMYQAFKFDVISKLDSDAFEIGQEFVRQWLSRRWKQATDEDVRQDLDAGDTAG